MTTTPEATKGVPRVEGNPAPTLRADHNALADWVRDNITPRVATTTARDAITTKWVGMLVQTADTNTLWMCTAVGNPGTWKVLVEDTGWVALPLAGTWVNFGGAYGDARYRRINGMVEVTGLVKSGSAVAGAVIGTLPVGFRPASFAVHTVWGNGAVCSVEIGPNGNIVGGDTGIFTIKTSLTLRFPAEA